MGFYLGAQCLCKLNSYSIYFTSADRFLKIQNLWPGSDYNVMVHAVTKHGYTTGMTKGRFTIRKF